MTGQPFCALIVQMETLSRSPKIGDMLFANGFYLLVLSNPLPYEGFWGSPDHEMLAFRLNDQVVVLVRFRYPEQYKLVSETE